MADKPDQDQKTEAPTEKKKADARKEGDVPKSRELLTAAVMLAARHGDDKVTLVAGISKDLQSRKMSAGDWIRPVAAAVGGGGGGRPDLAQAGGKDPAKLPEALQIAKATIREMIGG